MSASQVVLVKHALPILEPGVAARDWRLGSRGESQAKGVVVALQAFVPCRVVSSPEPKAQRTAAVVSQELDVAMSTVDGLREIDRPILPIMSPEEHERFNAQLFLDMDRRVVGQESALEARERFGAAVLDQARETKEPHLVVIAHGTVIALAVSQHNAIDAFELWKRLRCPSFVVVENPSIKVVKVVERIDGIQTGA